jgi:predicted permease
MAEKKNNIVIPYAPIFVLALVGFLLYKLD